MRSNFHAVPGLLIIFVSMLALMVGCTPTATSQSQQSTAASELTGQPIEVVSVQDTYQSGQTVTPGGPTIKITLKNISEEPIVSLNVTLEEGGPRSFDYDFDVTKSNPLLPNELISSERRCIGGGWGGGIPYFLIINGTMESGEVFTFTWEPSD
jgi:hypothetical protein